MSNLQYHAYEGVGTHNLKAYHYNQAVRIPAGADRVELAGQGITVFHNKYIQTSTNILDQAAGIPKPAK